MLPGNTDLSSYNKGPSGPITSLSLPLERPAIILATNDVNDDTLFRNGLTQNIVVLYDLFESMGYKAYLFQHGGDAGSAKKDFILGYRTTNPHELLRNPIPIHAFIEIGMSVDSNTRAYLRSIGAKIVKLYLGNILNIDIETIQNFRSMFFNHHVVGELDEIWTSPHYKQHLDYAAILNRTDISKARVVPYVWDPCFITQYGARETIEWIAPVGGWTTQDIVIMDPNISFQKCSFYSLLLVEAFAQKYPEWQGKIQVINGDRLQLEMNSFNFVLPSLSLWRAGRIVLQGRKNIHTILKENRSACFMTHQWNNDFNYMTLELLYCNYPILHNSQGWDQFGYHYSIDKWVEAIETLRLGLQSHRENMRIYKTHAANLIWKHSVHNPDIQAEWKTIL
jgi:hypothetical protein